MRGTSPTHDVHNLTAVSSSLRVSTSTLTSSAPSRHVTTTGYRSTPTPAGWSLGLRAITAAVASSTLSTHITRHPSAMFPVPSSSPTVEHKPGGDRFPVALLWLPYVTLTLLLSALLVASFLHFHCKNGHKYKKRRSTNGNGNENGDETGSASGVRHVAFSDNDVTPPQGVAVIDCSSAVTCFRYTNPPCSRQRQHVPVIGWDDDHGGRPRKCNGDIDGDDSAQRSKNQHTKERAVRKGDCSRLSVEFVANRNGSMVNMRCADGGVSSTPMSDTNRRDAGGRSRVAATPRPYTARVAPARSTTSGPGLLEGRRPDKRTASDVHVDWPNGPLYSAMRICKMDDTADDWNRLLDHSKL